MRRLYGCAYSILNTKCMDDDETKGSIASLFDNNVIRLCNKIPILLYYRH